jgi:carboxymethylenebutenolidase
MGHKIDLTASDGHRLSAYLSEPSGKARGGIVVIQEIFGVTRHIRDVADQYAAQGYLAIAPALFDRVERDVDVPYSDSAPLVCRWTRPFPTTAAALSSTLQKSRKPQ